MKVLIVEDEPHARAELVRLITKVIPDAEVVDYIDSIEDGVAWFKKNESPDLVFLDIQLSDGLSFDLLDKVEINCPIIFTTAYDEYAIRAFDHNSVDYLLKPIELEDLQKGVDKLNFFKTPSASPQDLPVDQLRKLITGESNNYKKRFLIRQGETIRYILADNIAYFLSSSENTYLITTDKKKYLVEYTLSQLENILDPHLFFRATRKFILNINAVETVSKYFNNRLKVTVNPSSEQDILVSRAKATEFLNWMEQ